MRSFQTLDISDARLIIERIQQATIDDGGAPVAVAVVDSAGRLIAFEAMEDVLPVSTTLAQNKAYTAIAGRRDTKEWADKGRDPSLFTDPRFTCFAGGVVVAVEGGIVGAVGVSGRRGSLDDLSPSDTKRAQDHELASYGRDCFFERFGSQDTQ